MNPAPPVTRKRFLIEGSASAQPVWRYFLWEALPHCWTVNTLTMRPQPAAMRERIVDFALLARRVTSGMMRPFGFLRWM